MTFKQDSPASTTPSDEAILEAMTIFDPPWEESHDFSLYLPPLEHLNDELQKFISLKNVNWVRHPKTNHDVLSEGNFTNIYLFIPINIFKKPKVMVNITIGPYFTPNEIITYTTLFK